LKCELTLEITDLHACPSEKQFKRIDVPTDAFSQIEVTSTKTEIDEELALEGERAKTTEKKRIRAEPLVSFKIEGGKITFPLGGPYGKLTGLFKEAGSALYVEKVEGFKTTYKSFIRSLSVKPQRVPLEDVEDIEIREIPQITAGIRRSLMIQYYECVPQCKATVSVNVPKGGKKKFETLLKQCEGMSFGPKRRAEITVHEMKWI